MQGCGNGQGDLRRQFFPLCLSLRMMADGLVSGKGCCSLLSAYPSVSAVGQEIHYEGSHLTSGLKHCGYGQAETLGFFL